MAGSVIATTEPSKGQLCLKFKNGENVINLYDYLELRGVRALSVAEAEVLGFPLKTGWLKSHGKDKLDKITIIQLLLYGANSKSLSSDHMKCVAKGLLEGKEVSDYILVTGEDRHEKSKKVAKVRQCSVKPTKIKLRLCQLVMMSTDTDDQTLAVIVSEKLGYKPSWEHGVSFVLMELYKEMRRLKTLKLIKPETAKTENSEFFRSQAWKSLRYNAFSKHGNNCQCCGVKAGNGIILHVDHIKPRSLYPELEYDIDNLQILCEDCNVGKLHVKEDDWR